MLSIQWWLIIGAAGMITFMLLTRSVKKPIQYFWYGLLYTAVGALCLFLLNLIGRGFGLELAINPFTSFIVGFLGLPGLGYLTVVEVFLF